MHIEKAYAKINLFLNVTKRRKDGFHNLQTIMCPLSLHDLLIFKESDDVSITSNNFITNNLEDNLVYKIVNHIKKEFHISKGINVHIEKNIPMGAGLAGGSADAAATLRALNEIWNLGLTLDELALIGEQYGADIPFCIYNKTAYAESKGEQLKFIENNVKSNVLLVNPEVHCSTKEIFNTIDNGLFQEIDCTMLIESIKKGDYKNVQEGLFNLLEIPVFEIYPNVENLKKYLLELFQYGVSMSGSGSTVFALINKEIEKEIIQKIKQKYNIVELTTML